MLLGVIADDFTGASDIAATLVKGRPGEGGLRTMQFLGVPTRPAPPHVEAGVVSLKSRSVRAEGAVRDSLAALDWLRAQGARQIVFKYCSTFDSTPAGNIGPVAEALAAALGVAGVVVCPSFPTLGRTLFKGHLFVGDKLLSESGMQHHPLNPMDDPDLRRVLRRQTRAPVGHVDRAMVAQGPAPLAAALAAAAARGETLVVVDAITDEDLVTIGEACAGVPLLTGGSGIAMGLPHNFIVAGAVREKAAGIAPVDGPEVILAGSCSQATRGQIAHHAAEHPARAIPVAALMDGGFDADDAVAFVRDNAGRAPLLYSSAEPAAVAAAQERYGRDVVAERIESVFGVLARRLVESGIRRLVVAGGETAGAVVGALDLDRLAVGREIDPGVPVLVADGPPALGLALKSGNFGGVNFFARALACIGGAA